MIPIVSVVGKSGSGKTTLLEALIPELKRRGYRIGTIKHDAHSFEIDRPGKDTWRHAQAGSDHVVISSPERVASIRRVRQELTLEELVGGMTDIDLVLTEGYKRGNAPKIEVSRRARSETLICDPAELVAVASDQHFDLDVPQYDLDDVLGLADLIEARFLRSEIPSSQSHRQEGVRLMIGMARANELAVISEDVEQVGAGQQKVQMLDRPEEVSL